MEERIMRALAEDRVIDITTIGRKTGKPRRIEIWFHNQDGRIFISGLPGKRDWYANLLVNPEFIFHLKRSLKADLPARAEPIIAETQRREIMQRIIDGIDREQELEEWIKNSPLVEVKFK